MRRFSSVLPLALMACLAFTSGCRRSSDEVWDDTKSASRHIGRGFKSLWGDHDTSRQVMSREEFAAYNDQYARSRAYRPDDFIPLPQEEAYGDITMADMPIPPPAESPGDPGSSVPSIDAFRDPQSDPSLGAVFKTIHFPYNSSQIQGEGNISTIQAISRYMRSRPKSYVFVEGHCDQRGPQAYNLALGARRSNAVRSLLVQDGVSPDNIFTISYGKERPIALGNDEESWAQNRRAEFKVYQH